MGRQNTDVVQRPDVALKDEIREPRRARVILLNDDYTSMEFVVRVLMEVFHKQSNEATSIMLAIHEKGSGVCGIYPVELAETKVLQVHSRARAEGFPLRCLVEPL